MNKSDHQKEARLFLCTYYFMFDPSEEKLGSLIARGKKLLCVLCKCRCTSKQTFDRIPAAAILLLLRV